MRKFYLFLNFFILAFCLTTIVYAQDVRVEAFVNTNTVSLGSSINLTLKVTGAPSPTMSFLPSWKILPSDSRERRFCFGVLRRRPVIVKPALFPRDWCQFEGADGHLRRLAPISQGQSPDPAPTGRRWKGRK